MKKHLLLFFFIISFFSCDEEPENSYVLKVSVLPSNSGQVDPLMVNFLQARLLS